jgi:hypothetical protein
MPLVALIRRAETEHIKQEGNAYFALVGLSAPQGQDIEAAGRRLHDENQRRLAAPDKTTEFRAVDPYSQPGALEFKGDLGRMCSVWRDYLYENGVCKFQAESDRMMAETTNEHLQRQRRCQE